jgi:hypothetical protein
MNDATPSSALRNAIIIGTVLQLAMVISGHYIDFIKVNVFAIGGVVISALAGALYARDARVSRSASAGWGAIAGGACALIGIAVSCALGDVQPIILALGTCSSAIGGAVGGAITGGKR